MAEANSELGLHGLTALTDPQYHSYQEMALAWDALAAGRLDEAANAAGRAAAKTLYFPPVALPLGTRAARWSQDIESATQGLEELSAVGQRGYALDADIRATWSSASWV